MPEWRKKWQKTQIHRTILLTAETVTDRMAQERTATDRMAQALTAQAARPLTSLQIRHPMYPDKTAQVQTATKGAAVTQDKTIA